MWRRQCDSRAKPESLKQGKKILRADRKEEERCRDMDDKEHLFRHTGDSLGMWPRELSRMPETMGCTKLHCR